jgi:hypothetical protein
VTELHADNLSRHLHELSLSFERAVESGDKAEARRRWLELIHGADTVIREARAARIEADALESELLTYRPARSDRPPAPPLAGYVYVFTAKVPWVCAAIEVRQLVYVPALFGGGYEQEHYAPERKTVCGKVVAYPVSERFTSGGWPRLHELCPDCTRALAAKGVLGQALAATDGGTDPCD